MENAQLRPLIYMLMSIILITSQYIIKGTPVS